MSWQCAEQRIEKKNTSRHKRWEAWEELGEHVRLERASLQNHVGKTSLTRTQQAYEMIMGLEKHS